MTREAVVHRALLQKKRQRELRLRAARRAAGVCPRCGDARERGDRVDCAGCRARSVAATARYKRRRRARRAA